MSHKLLVKYRTFLTTGEDELFKDDYEQWKVELSATEPSHYRDAFRRLETATTWKALTDAMNDVGFSAYDLSEHAEVFKHAGDHQLAAKLQEVFDTYGQHMST